MSQDGKSSDFTPMDPEVAKSLLCKPIIRKTLEKLSVRNKGVSEEVILRRNAGSSPIEADLKPIYSKLHTKSTNNWIRKRYIGKVTNKYLYYPEEIKKRQQMMAIFKQFDSDGNEQLDQDEFLTMMIDTYISAPDNPANFKAKNKIDPVYQFTEEEIDQIKEFLQPKIDKLYRFVTKRDFLSKQEFINLALDPNATDFFADAMRELSEMIKVMRKTTEMIIPNSFEKMTSYLGYDTNRNNLYHDFRTYRDYDYSRASVHLEELLFLKDSEIKQAGENQKKLFAYRQKTTGRSGSFRVPNREHLAEGIRDQIKALQLDDYSSQLPQDSKEPPLESEPRFSHRSERTEQREGSQLPAEKLLAQAGFKEASGIHPSAHKSSFFSEEKVRDHDQAPIGLSKTAKSRIRDSISKTLKDSVSKAQDEVSQALGKYLQSRKPSVMKIIKADTLGSTVYSIGTFGVTRGTDSFKKADTHRLSQTRRESWLFSQHQSSPALLKQAGHQRFASDTKPGSNTTAPDNARGQDPTQLPRNQASWRMTARSFGTNGTQGRSPLETFTSGVYKSTQGVLNHGSMTGGRLRNTVNHGRVQSLGRHPQSVLAPIEAPPHQPYLLFG